jgi:dTDP-4-amino-4,6-dideoxygalactose transaminase
MSVAEAGCKCTGRTSAMMNHRMDELRLVQLGSLCRWNRRRRDLVGGYRDARAERCPEVRVPFANAERPSAYHFLPAPLPSSADREVVMGRMQAAGIQTTVHFPPIHRLSFYRDRDPSLRLPHTEAFAGRELNLPLHPKLEDGDIETVADALAAALKP